MEAETYLWGTVGTIVGVIVAVVLFMIALRFVARAREGNRRVREAHHDPHAAPKHPDRSSQQAIDDRRDIGQ